MMCEEKCDLVRRLTAEVAMRHNLKGFEYRACEYGGGCLHFCELRFQTAMLFYDTLEQLGIPFPEDEFDELDRYINEHSGTYLFHFDPYPPVFNEQKMQIFRLMYTLKEIEKLKNGGETHD
jgi:hypothetical protein